MNPDVPAPGPSLPRRAAAELIGTALLVASVVGSGAMGERLAGGNQALALLANTLATGAALVALIVAFGPLSGAHFNPLVTLVAWIRRRNSASDVAAFVAAQLVGALLGVFLAHAMFDLPLLDPYAHERRGWSQWLSEIVATLGLLVVVFAVSGPGRERLEGSALAVGAYVSAGYWFTASTCFANPAVTIARGFTGSFSGIRPRDVPPFLVAQLAAAALATVLLAWLLPARRQGARSP